MCQTLIVEDNAIFRKSLREMLCAYFPFMHVEEAADGNEAWRKMDLLSPHIVFTDIRLPGANGLELTRKIRANYRDTVVIVLTSHDLPEYRSAAYQSGADYFLPKGFTRSDEILEVVRSVIARG